MIIGLTGGIGSGKSAAADFFIDLGISVLDADQVAKEALSTNSPGYTDFISQFGEVYLNNNREVDRLKLRELIFSNPSKKKDLENIIHPIVRSAISNFIITSTSPYSIVMVPLIFETKSYKNYDKIITVDCDLELQIARASSRDAQNKSQIKSIINKQASRKERLSISDDILINNSTLSDLKKQVNVLHTKYMELLNE
ncbi:dephospho-CoA kinase [Gammaproteobacteria bacterium]|nr:dephospho-CoA kinase [Gammaproteobacteria bacterium]